MTKLVLKRANGKSLYMILKFANLNDAMKYAGSRLGRLVDILDSNNNSLFLGETK